MNLLEWVPIYLIVLGLPSILYWKGRKDVIKLINELKGDVPAMAEIFAESIKTKVRGSLGGVLSGESRLDKGLSTRMMNDFMNSQSPIAGWIMQYAKESLPYLQDHPELLPQLLKYAGQYLPNLGGNSPQGLNTEKRKLGLNG